MEEESIPPWAIKKPEAKSTAFTASGYGIPGSQFPDASLKYDESAKPFIAPAAAAAWNAVSGALDTALGVVVPGSKEAKRQAVESYAGPSSEEFYQSIKDRNKEQSIKQPSKPDVVRAEVVSLPKTQPKSPQFETIGDLIKFSPQNGDEWEIKRSYISNARRALLEEASQYYLSAGLDPDEYERAMSSAEKQISRKGLTEEKPWTESTTFKSFNDYFGRAGYQQNAFSLGQLRNTILEARQLQSEGAPKQQVISLLKANVPKILQSLGTGQSDAIQQPEWARVATELSTIFNTKITDWPALLQDKDKIANLFSTDPDQFMKKAEQVYDAARGHFNRHYESSLRVNGKKMTDQMPGAEFFEPISSGGLKNTSKAETMLRSYGVKPFASQEGDPQSFLRSVNQSRNQGRLQFGGIKTSDVPAEAPR